MFLHIFCFSSQKMLSFHQKIGNCKGFSQWPFKKNHVKSHIYYRYLGKQYTEHVQLEKEKWPELTALCVTSLFFVLPLLLGSCCILELGGCFPGGGGGTREEAVAERRRQGGHRIEEAVKSPQISHGSEKNGLAGAPLPSQQTSPRWCSCEALPTLVCCVSCRLMSPRESTSMTHHLPSPSALETLMMATGRPRHSACLNVGRRKVTLLLCGLPGYVCAVLLSRHGSSSVYHNGHGPQATAPEYPALKKEKTKSQGHILQ